MKSIIVLSTLMIGSFFVSSCTKEDKDNDTNTTTSSTLRILKSPTGQYQTISADISSTGNLNFNPQTLLADGGNPLHNYTWSIENGTGAPTSLSIEPLTGVIKCLSKSSAGFSEGLTTFKVKVSDGSATRVESIDLKVTKSPAGYPSPLAILQQLSSPFQLRDGEANKVYGASLFCMGGTPPYKWSLDETYSGSADLTNAGLTVEGNGGIITGKILNSAAGKTIKFKVVVTDNVGDVAVYSPVYTIKVL